MSDLTKITPAQLKSAWKQTAAPLQISLSKEDGLFLLALLNQTTKRYPNQDLTDAIPEYMIDLERLALKYSLQSVEDAIGKLRTDPEQHFFPTPDEIAHQIEQSRLRNVPSHIYARG